MSFLTLLFLAGLLVYLYPYLSDRWNAFRNRRLAAGYAREGTAADAGEEAKILADADEYNRRLAETARALITERGKENDAEYESLLSTGGSGMMGYIEIPSLAVMIPVYHGSDDAVLENGAGHIQGSSLPVGGSGTHAILTGHRGLPTSRLFTDLDRMKTGDRFYLHMFGRDLAYAVTSVRTVLPFEVSDLVIEPGEDLVTLVTCTPYGVNTHRLLVTGKRCAYDAEEKENEEETGRRFAIRSRVTPQNMMAAGLAVFVPAMAVYSRIQKKRERQKRQNGQKVQRQERGETGPDSPFGKCGGHPEFPGNRDAERNE